jgi:hypothetical protein
MVDFLGKIAGPALKDNLLRLGVDLSVETSLLYLDVNNLRVGINTATPNVDLDANGTVNFKNRLQINAANINNLINNDNIYITTQGTGQVIIQGNASIGNISIGSNVNVGNVNVTYLSSAQQLQSTVTTGTTPLLVNSTTRVSNLNVATAGNLINGNSSVTVNPNGNVNISVTGTSNVLVVTPTGANISGTANVTGTIYGVDGNLTGNLTVGGNVTMANLNLANIVSNGNLTANTLVVNNSANLGNISINNVTISSIPVNSNIYLAPNGTGGMIRWNQSTTKFEWYDGTNWNSVTSAQTQLTSDAFTGDGSTNVFTLSQTSTTAATLVSINGVVQTPTTAYTISGTTLTFTEIPAAGDVIEARTMVTVSATTDLSDGTTSVVVSNSAPKISMKVRGTIKVDVNSTDVILYNSNIVNNVTAQTVNGSATTIDQWPTANYTSAKYLVSITNGTSRQMTELLMTANSTNAYLSNIGSVNSGSSLMSFTANITTGNATLWGTGVGSGNSVKVSRTLIV